MILKNEEHPRKSNFGVDDETHLKRLYAMLPALGVSVKSVHLVAGRLGFYSQSGHTKDFKNTVVFAAFAPGARHKRKCEGFCVCVVRHVMSLNSVQSFVIENCNGPTIENGLNNVCLHPLSRTFTFICDVGFYIVVLLFARTGIMQERMVRKTTI